MRIIAGAAKGRRLNAPRAGTRPFTGRAKEAVFSILGPRLEGASVLDLFAGSGSLGLEALSRGASVAVFVESDRRAVEVITANVDAVGLGGEVIRSDALIHARRDERFYDVIFVDPPYALDDDAVDLVLASAGARLAADGTIVLHRRAGGSSPESDNLRCTGRRRYGDGEIWIFEKEQS